MSTKYQIIIPTRDSASWLQLVLDFYKQNCINPLFIVDMRTIDQTRDLINRSGFNYLEFTPRGNFPEAGMIQFGAENAQSDWLLRIDDDELPTMSLLKWADEIGSKSRNQCWFISRRELFLNEKGIAYSRSIGKYPITEFPDKLHPMARFFNAKLVRFKEEIHTTGFEDLSLYNFVPQEYFIVHFNCLLHTIKTRLKKIKYYESIKPGSTWQLADEYLPELFSSEFHNASYDGLEYFDHIFLSLKNYKPKDLTISEEDRSHAIEQVKLRARKITKERSQFLYSGSRLKQHFDADNFSWIDNLPIVLRHPLAQLINTLLPNYYKKYGSTMWDYIHLYK